MGADVPSLPLEALSDDELWARFVRGDDAAVYALERRYRRELYWYLLLSTGKEDQAAAHLRRSWALLSAYRRPYEGFDSFRNWIYAVVTQNGVPATHPEAFGFADLIDDLRRAPRQDQRGRLFFAIVDMARPVRQPFLLVMLAGLSIEQAARACNFTPRRVRESLAKAFRALSACELFAEEAAGAV